MANTRSSIEQKKLAVARLWHEGNVHAPLPTRLEDFRHREWVRGSAAIAYYRDTRVEMGAVVDFAAARPDWSVHWGRCAAAPPGGPVAQPELDAIMEEIAADLESTPSDGVYLSLHGALCGTDRKQADTALVRAVRKAIGPAVPLAVSLDLHANLDPAIAEAANIIVGYKTYPHVDMYETAHKALTLLDEAVRERIRPVSCIAESRWILPSHAMATGGGPMADITAAAARMERDHDLLDVTAYGGFAYGDGAHRGASASACTDGDPEAARAAAAAIARHFDQHHARFAVTLPDAAAGLAAALTAGPGPVAVLEPSDNPLSGGAGDTPELFRALLALPDPPAAVFAFFCDPALVGRCHEAGVGASLDTRLGGRLSRAWGEPVPFRGQVVRLTDGRFTNRGPMERGLACSIGRTAVLARDKLRVVVTETSQSPNDPAWCDLHGIDLASLGLFCVKAKNHFRAAFAPLMRAIIEVDTPGPAALLPPTLRSAA